MATIRSFLSLVGRRIWDRSTAEDDADTTDLGSSPASAEKSMMVSTDATISKPSGINFLELPVEVRMITYEYCYDTCDLTLQYGYGPQMQKTKCTKRSPLRQKMYGVPARIHQVCRSLAQETGPMWEKHTTSLVLEHAATDNTCMSHFTVRRAFANLRHRLVSLEISNKHLPRIRSGFHIVWDRLLLGCPNLRIVALKILNTGSTDVPWNLPRGLDSMNATESLVCHMMSEDSRSGEEMQLGRYDLLSLAASLESRHKGTYSVTASVRNIMNLTDWGSGNSLGLSYDMKWVYKYSPKRRKTVSRTVEAWPGIRGQWLPGQPTPTVTFKDSGDWQELVYKAPTGRGDSSWRFPWTSAETLAMTSDALNAMVEIVGHNS